MRSSTALRRYIHRPHVVRIPQESSATAVRGGSTVAESDGVQLTNYGFFTIGHPTLGAFTNTEGPDGPIWVLG